MAKSFISHQTTAGERWDLLAHRYYGDANKAGVIIDANLHIAIMPTLPDNLTVLVPILPASNTSANVELPPWMRNGGDDA